MFRKYSVNLIKPAFKLSRYCKCFKNMSLLWILSDMIHRFKISLLYEISIIVIFRKLHYALYLIYATDEISQIFKTNSHNSSIQKFDSFMFLENQ